MSDNQIDQEMVEATSQGVVDMSIEATEALSND